MCKVRRYRETEKDRTIGLVLFGKRNRAVILKNELTLKWEKGGNRLSGRSRVLSNKLSLIG